MVPKRPAAEASEKLVLTFPAHLVREPITYNLIKEYDLLVNIMRASISSDEQGHLVVELVGTPKDIEAGKAYLSTIGVRIQLLTSDVAWLEERCTHCTACVSVCPTRALDVDRTTMKVHFDADTCIGCGLCIAACAYGAMEVRV